MFFLAYLMLEGTVYCGFSVIDLSKSLSFRNFSSSATPCSQFFSVSSTLVEGTSQSPIIDFPVLELNLSFKRRAVVKVVKATRKIEVLLKSDSGGYSGSWWPWPKRLAAAGEDFGRAVARCVRADEAASLREAIFRIILEDWMKCICV